MNLTKTLVPLFHLWVHFWIFHGQKRKKTAVQPRRTIVIWFQNSRNSTKIYISFCVRLSPTEMFSLLFRCLLCLNRPFLCLLFPFLPCPISWPCPNSLYCLEVKMAGTAHVPYLIFNLQDRRTIQRGTLIL